MKKILTAAVTGAVLALGVTAVAPAPAEAKSSWGCPGC